MRYLSLILVMAFVVIPRTGTSLNSGDINVKLISGYFWMDNSCTPGGPLGKVVSFRIINTKGTLIQNFKFELTGLTFVPNGGTSYNSGTPSFICRTSTSVFLGDIPAGDSVTAFFFVGYNCLMYPNNTNITTDYLTLSTKASDINSGTVTNNFNKTIYVLKNANNNTITILATSTNTVGTLTTISVAYNISNVKPTNIIDMELSTTGTFPAGYSIVGCKITASTITADFPLNMTNTHYSNSIATNLPSGGTVTIEWYLKITQASTGISSSNLVPYIVSDAGSAQRWQANTTTFTGTTVPSNPITMTKRASKINNMVNDTLSYTIVIKNSSTLTDVTIDRLVDKLPRDFQYRYMETNTGVFPRLVTYSNSTAYPSFQDTNYLFFNGHKQLLANTYSWVIPKQDSIKLIYSVQVSSLAGMADTNFIYAYVGNDRVADAFAKVNVLSTLPVKLIYFDADRQDKGVSLKWVATDIKPGERFELYRLDPLTGAETMVKSILIDQQSSVNEMSCFDNSEAIESLGNFQYKLVHIGLDETRNSWIRSIDDKIRGIHLDVRNSENYFILDCEGIADRNLNVRVTDLSGRTIYEGLLEFRDGIGLLPVTQNMQSGLLMITVYTPSWNESAKAIKL